MEHPDSGYLAEIHRCLDHSNAFFSLLYRARLWLTERQSETVRAAGREMLASYKRCAAYAHELGLPRFKLQPKLHFAMHIVMSTQGSPCLNILAHSCQQNEDFINKISMVCRNVSQQNLHMNVMLQYLVSVARHW